MPLMRFAETIGDRVPMSVTSAPAALVVLYRDPNSPCDEYPRFVLSADIEGDKVKGHAELAEVNDRREVIGFVGHDHPLQPGIDRAAQVAYEIFWSGGSHE